MTRNSTAHAAGASDVGSVSVLDPETVQGLDEMASLVGPAFLVRTLAHYDGAWREALSDMKAAAAASDGLALRESAHKIKGAAAILGAARVARVAAALEVAASQQAWEQAKALIVEFEAAAPEAAIELRRAFRLDAGPIT